MNQTFEPARIGSLQIKNRIARSATWEGMADENGLVTEKLLRCYRELAQGGVGLLITGYGVVSPEGIQFPGSLSLHDESAESGLRALTTEVQKEGARIFCQLVHVGNQASSKMTGRQPLAPSAVQDGTSPELPKEMTTEEIDATINAFVAAAKRCQRCGFDGVQLHGAHGYLINQFLSPLTNQRSDAYGGSLENRMRFLCELVERLRAELGAEYPLMIKLTASDNLEGGFSLEEAVKVAKKIEELGIDAIEVSSGTAAAGKLGPCRMKIDDSTKEGYNAEAAKAVSSAVEIPVWTVGGIRTLELAEHLLADGQLSGISLSRPLIREPDLPNRWKADPGHRATCISCNGCFKPGLKEGGIRCILEPVES